MNVYAGYSIAYSCIINLLCQQLPYSSRRYICMVIAVCEEPETLDAGALHRVVGRTSSVSSNGDEDVPPALCAAAERARSDERSAAPLNVKRHDQPCPDRRLDKIQKKVSLLFQSSSMLQRPFKFK